MKKDLAELNKKIRRSRKKHDNLIRRKNNLMKAIDEMIRMKQSSTPIPEAHKFEFKELAQAFSLAYRSYRLEGEPGVDPDTFFKLINKDVINLIAKELNELRSARIQTATWIRFLKDEEKVELAFNSRMTDFFKGSGFEQLVKGMLNHMKEQI